MLVIKTEINATNTKVKVSFTQRLKFILYTAEIWFAFQVYIWQQNMKFV